MDRRIAPTTRLVAIAVAGLVVAIAAVMAATSAPWLGVDLRPADQGAAARIVGTAGPSAGLGRGALTAVGTAPVGAEDLIEEVDYLATYAEVDAFFARQDALLAALRQPSVGLQVRRDDGRVETVAVAPSVRPLSALPGAFWMQLVFGLGGLFIGGWIWAIRSRDPAAIYFALTGVGMLCFSTAAGVYSTRELTLGGPMFRLLSAVNHSGAMLFGAAMIALFCVYPRKIAPGWLLAAMWAGFAAWLAVDLMHLVPGVGAGASGAVTAQMLLIVAAIAAQWWANAKDPVGKAALRWLGLSVIVGAGAFIGLSIVPTLFGAEPLVNQGYAFGFFLLIYVGIAIGLRRHRLFELDEWAFRIAFYALGVLCLIALDAALVFVLQLGAAASLTLALAAVALFYLPLREALWRRFVARRRLSDEDLFGVVVEAALAPGSERPARWRALLVRLFDPLEVEPADEAAPSAAIGADGLEMTLPAAADGPALRLRYPWRGRGLFGPAHLRLAQRALMLLERIEAGRHAYELGRTEERRRIAHDLHDDVGAILLSALHKPELAATRQTIRNAIGDVRAIVDELTGERRPLAHVLADLRFETAQRLEDAGLVLDWDLPEASEAVVIDYAVARALRSALREVVSNTIRHARATTLRVAVALEGGAVTLVAADDGRGLADGDVGKGLGLRSLERRLLGVGGQIAFIPGGGAKVRMVFPLTLGAELGA